jgi:hypothetical protein
MSLSNRFYCLVEFHRMILHELNLDTKWIIDQRVFDLLRKRDIK